MIENANALITGRRFRIAFFCSMVVGLGGCATSQDVLHLEQSPMDVPIKVLVMEAPISIGPDRLRTVFAPGVKPGLQASAGLIAQGERHAQEYALASMEEALGKQAKLDVITPPAEAGEPIDKIQAKNFGSALTSDEADWLRATTGADALLRFDITDYGLTPRSWRKGYITFEVSSTLAVAAIIAYSGSTVAKTAAGAYLAQETVEETAEGYAGFWALDVVCRPVRIEAELVRLNPLTTVWESRDTGLSDIRLSRLTRKVASSERETQLDQATNYAVKNVVSDLADALENIKPERDR